jgi:hypothetical protein
MLTLSYASESCTHVISELHVFTLFVDRKRNLKDLDKDN